MSLVRHRHFRLTQEEAQCELTRNSLLYSCLHTLPCTVQANDAASTQRQRCTYTMAVHLPSYKDQALSTRRCQSMFCLHTYVPVFPRELNMEQIITLAVLFRIFYFLLLLLLLLIWNDQYLAYLFVDCFSCGHVKLEQIMSCYIKQ